MGLWRANLTVGPFRQGEIVDIDETEFASYIEKGWLRPFAEGHVVPPRVALPSAAEPVSDVSPATPQPGDTAPPVEDAFVTPTSFEAHAVDDDLGLGDR